MPLLTAGALLLAYRNYDMWEVYVIMCVIAELILWFIIRRATRTTEYLSAYSVDVQHHEPWTERVVRHESYTDSRGNTRTRTVVYYRHHPDLWLISFNTGVCRHISRQDYDRIRRIWGTSEIWIDPPHTNCVAGGGGQLYKWNRVYEDAVTHSYEGRYINYVLNSNSIFRHEEISRHEAAELGLIDYPAVDSCGFDHTVILSSSKLPDGVVFSPQSQHAFQLINAFAGQRHQIHVFILVFDAAQGVAAALKQRAYWHGGNKNEFTVCLGVDFTQPDTAYAAYTTTTTDTDPDRTANYRMPGDPKGTVKWCKAFSWCDMPQLESATESWFIANAELSLGAYAEWLGGHLHLWKRKSFKDFKYLGINLSPQRKVILSIAAVAICALMAGIMYYIETETR